MTDRRASERADRSAAAPPLAALLLDAASGLFPGYFALVMATGIVSIAAELMSYRWVAVLLLGVAWLAYLVLWALTILRVIFNPRRIVLDLSTHARAPGFFTTVAGTGVLGTQTVIVAGVPGIGAALWVFALGLWFVVMYAFCAAVTIRRNKPRLVDGINGAWLIPAVATQSIVVLKTTLAATFAPSPLVQLLCLAFFMIGCMLYLVIIPLIFYRLTFLRFSATDFGPPYWINMGAAAIAMLAGSLLVLRAENWPVLVDYLPFLKGLTLFFWATASWWIPFLIALMLWRYLVRRDPVRYDPQLWSMVFPLGMYATGTFQLAQALKLPFLMRIPEIFVFVAIAAWTATFAGLLASLARSIIAGGRGP